MATGQYIKQPHGSSDLVTTLVQALEDISTTYVTTSPIDCRGYRQVDFFVHLVTDGTGLVSLTVKPEAGQDLAGTIKYAPYLLEVTGSGSGASATWIYELTLDDPTPADDTVYKISLPVEGRYVRLNVKANAVQGTYIVYAARRV
tara:strand:- start:2906 stop:3340 length:435 start_codon:yes stop_codon:yes gene_type:complete